MKVANMGVSSTTPLKHELLDVINYAKLNIDNQKEFVYVDLHSGDGTRGTSPWRFLNNVYLNEMIDRPVSVHLCEKDKPSRVRLASCINDFEKNRAGSQMNIKIWSDNIHCLNELNKMDNVEQGLMFVDPNGSINNELIDLINTANGRLENMDIIIHISTTNLKRSVANHAHHTLNAILTKLLKRQWLIKELGGRHKFVMLYGTNGDRIPVLFDQGFVTTTSSLGKKMVYHYSTIHKKPQTTSRKNQIQEFINDGNDEFTLADLREKFGNANWHKAVNVFVDNEILEVVRNKNKRIGNCYKVISNKIITTSSNRCDRQQQIREMLKTGVPFNTNDLKEKYGDANWSESLKPLIKSGKILKNNTVFPPTYRSTDIRTYQNRQKMIMQYIETNPNWFSRIDICNHFPDSGNIHVWNDSLKRATKNGILERKNGEYRATQTSFINTPKENAIALFHKFGKKTFIVSSFALWFNQLPKEEIGKFPVNFVKDYLSKRCCDEWGILSKKQIKPKVNEYTFLLYQETSQTVGKVIRPHRPEEVNTVTKILIQFIQDTKQLHFKMSDFRAWFIELSEENQKGIPLGFWHAGLSLQCVRWNLLSKVAISTNINEYRPTDKLMKMINVNIDTHEPNQSSDIMHIGDKEVSKLDFAEAFQSLLQNEVAKRKAAEGMVEELKQQITLLETQLLNRSKNTTTIPHCRELTEQGNELVNLIS